MLTISEFARLGQVSPRMLRHYGETGLLAPAQIDAHTGYRFYDVAQLARLHRLVALRELGFSLEQIRPILEEGLPAGELRGMLRMRKAQIEQNLAGEQTRLRRIEAHLRALERGQVMELHDVVIKHSEPVRVAEAVVSAPGFGTENIGPVFRPLFRQVRAHLREAGSAPASTSPATRARQKTAAPSCTSDSTSAARTSPPATCCASSTCPRSGWRRLSTAAPWRTSPRPSRP